MAEESKSSDKKKVHPAAIIGPFVAIGASVFTVFIATGKDNKKPDAPPVEQAAQPTDPNAPTVQPAQFGQSEPGAPTTPTPPADTASAVSPDGSTISFSDDSLAYSAAIPPGPANDPVLADLRRDAQNYLASKKAEARSTLDDFKKQGDVPPGYPWEVKIEWEYTAKAGDIVSLHGSSYEFTGGAHGMTRYDTHIAYQNGKQIRFADMLQGGLSPAVVIAICEALKTMKKTNIGSATILDEPIVCAGPDANVKVERAKLALAPSWEPNKFGGIFVYYEPYEVGSYAEGGYMLTIPQEVFAEDLKPEFKPLFAGTVPPAVH